MSRIIGIDFLIRSLHTVVKTILAPNMGLSMENLPRFIRINVVIMKVG